MSKKRDCDLRMVVMTCPDLSDDRWRANVLVGESLHDFLSLGCECGYDALEGLSYDREGVIERLRNGPDPDGEDDEALATLVAYRRALGLKPWAGVEERLNRLETRKRFALRFSRFWPPWGL